MLICLVETGEGLRYDKDDPSRVQVSTSTFILVFLYLCFKKDVAIMFVFYLYPFPQFGCNLQVTNLITY